jgi:hypothetical protein
MYIESKAEGLNGPARIGRVTFNRAGRTLSYNGKSFQSLKGRGFKANYYETETGEEYWISGPRRDGLDRLYGKRALVVEIDADVREEYRTAENLRQLDAARLWPMFRQAAIERASHWHNLRSRHRPRRAACEGNAVDRY